MQKYEKVEVVGFAQKSGPTIIVEQTVNISPLQIFAVMQYHLIPRTKTGHSAYGKIVPGTDLRAAMLLNLFQRTLHGNNKAL